jgi:hypothetical protein
VIAMAFDDGGLRLSLAQAPSVTPILIQHWMTDVVAHLHAAVAKNIGDGGFIGRRTGDLARAIKDDVTVTSDGAEGTVWPDPTQVAYGTIQEEGGTVIPKTAQFLAIPLDAMLTGNGVARGTAAQVRADPTGFGFTGTFVHDGVIFGAEGSSRGASVIPLFALKSSVVLPARHYLAQTLEQELPWVTDRLERLTGQIVSVTFGDGAAA